MEFKQGETYKTKYAAWTVEYISNDGRLLCRREDGRTAWFSTKEMAEWLDNNRKRP